MKVVLPEKNGINKKYLIIYTLIIIVCIFSIIVAFYAQFYARIDIGKMLGISSLDIGEKTEEEVQILKTEFDDLFTNTVENVSEDNEKKKKDSDKQLIYTEIQKKETKLNSYDIEVYIPQINIDNEIINKYNQEIKDTFQNKTENVLKTENKNVIYSVEYVANIKDDILSLMIRSNLKEGSSAQRVIIQTYNYDLRNDKEITLQKILDVEQLDKTQVQNQIDEEIKLEQKKVEDLKKSGYNIYSRDVSSDIYKIENTKQYYLANNTVYIIYAYGNETFTSEMDLIIL